MWEETQAIKNWDDLLCLASNLFSFIFLYIRFDVGRIQLVRGTWRVCQQVKFVRVIFRVTNSADSIVSSLLTILTT